MAEKPPPNSQQQIRTDTARNHQAVAHLDKLITDLESTLNKEEKRTGSKVAWVIVFAVIGVIFFVSPVVLLWLQWNNAVKAVPSDTLQSNKANFNVAVANANNASGNAAATSVICGVFLEFVALAIFYYQGRTITDLKDQLNINNRFLLATFVCEGMDGESRPEAQTKLVEALLGYDLKNKEEQDPKKTAEPRVVNNSFSVHQPPAMSKQGDGKSS